MKRFHKKGAGGGGGGMGGMMMMGLLLMLILVFMLCEEQKKRKKLEDENKKLKEEIEKLKNQPPPTPPPAAPTNECLEKKGVVCDTEVGDSCDGNEIPAAAGANKLCCEKGCKKEKEPPLPPPAGSYPLNYIGGDESKTCAFQKGSNCGLAKYCPNDQWIKAKDTATCCKAGCVARVQHRDVDFGASLGKTTVERFSGNRFGVWYGAGSGFGFYDIGRPNYVESRNVGGEKYEFGVGGKKYGFVVTINEPARIEVSPSAQPSTPSPTEFDACTSDGDCISVRGGCCGCNQGGNARAINKGKQSEYEASLQCTGIVCAQVISTDASCSAIPKCIVNKCTLSASIGPTTVEVSMENFAYKPATLAIKKGTTVKWTNNDNVAHTVTSDKFDSKELQPGQSYSFTFNDAGEVGYGCSLHPATMKGSVAVT